MPGPCIDGFETAEKHRRYKMRRVTQTDAEVIPTFRPDEKSSNVKGWLHKIDQLDHVYGWDNKDCQFIMQICLRGSARDCAIHHRNYTTHPRMATTWRRCCCSSCKRDRLSTKEMLRLPKRRSWNKELQRAALRGVPSPGTHVGQLMVCGQLFTPKSE